MPCHTNTDSLFCDGDVTMMMLFLYVRIALGFLLFDTYTQTHTCQLPRAYLMAKTKNSVKPVKKIVKIIWLCLLLT